MKGFPPEPELLSGWKPRGQGWGAPPLQNITLAWPRVRALTPAAWQEVSGCLGPSLGRCRQRFCSLTADVSLSLAAWKVFS